MPGSLCLCGAFVSSTSAVDYPEASSLALAFYEWLQGTPGGVGESSGTERLTDVPSFGGCDTVEKFAQVPRDLSEKSRISSLLAPMSDKNEANKRHFAALDATKYTHSGAPLRFCRPFLEEQLLEVQKRGTA